MTTFLCAVASADDALRMLRADDRRSIYECYDGTFAIDHHGGVIGRDVIDDLYERQLIKRRWAESPELNCWVLAKRNR